jgi:hypothetical protein
MNVRPYEIVVGSRELFVMEQTPEATIKCEAGTNVGAKVVHYLAVDHDKSLPSMEVILLWPLLKGLSDSGNISCSIAASFETSGQRSEIRKHVRIRKNRPIIILIPGSVNYNSGLCSVNVFHCSDQSSSLLAFPHTFDISVQNGDEFDASTSLIRWDDVHEVSLEEGPRQLQFILSSPIVALPTPRDEPVSSPSQATISYERTSWSAHMKKITGIQFFFVCLVLLLVKSFLPKLFRLLKPSYQALRDFIFRND